MRAPKKPKVSVAKRLETVSVAKRSETVPHQVLAVAKKASASRVVVTKPAGNVKSKVISALKRLHPMD